MKTIQQFQRTNEGLPSPAGDFTTVIRPLVSFVIPVYNDEKNISRCLQSIKNQVFPTHDIELVILDNGSTDRTPMILEEMGTPFHVVPNVHVSGLRNYGASLAHGEYLAFVDSDVELVPQWLSKGLEAFRRSDVVANGCFPNIPKESTWVQRTWDIHQRGRHLLSGPSPVSWLPSMNLVVRRQVFWDVGGFNEALETAEDVDLCYRLGKRGVILCNPAMEAIHWGEARDLATFWKKEVWRGLGNMAGVKSHGWRRDEVPSLLYPLYMIVCSASAVVSWLILWLLGQWWWIPLSLGAMGLPAAVLSMRTARQANKYIAVPSLFLLYLTYGLARAYSVGKAFVSGMK